MAGSAVIGSLRVDLGIDSATFQNGLKNAQSALQKFGRLAKVGMVAAAAAVGTAVGSMGLAVKNTIDAADDMSKAASKIGVPIEELSRLKYAADLSGVSFEGLQTAVGRLSRVMNDAKNGSKEAVDSFAQLGISATKADGSLKASSDILKEIADKFATMPDGAEKTALAMDVMGRSGANMIPLLNGGSEALGTLMAEADKFGQVFSTEMGASAEVFNDNISRLTGAFGNLAAKIATEMLPHLERFTNWLVENAPAISAWAGSVVNGVGVVIEQFRLFQQDVATIATAITSLIQWFTNLDTALRQFGETIRGNLAAAWDSMIAKIGEVKVAITAFAQGLLEDFKALPGQMMAIGAQIIDGLWQGLKSKFASVKEGLTGFASGLVGSVKSTLGIQSPSKVMTEVGNNIMQGLGDGMTSMQGGVESIAESIASSIGSAFQGVIDGSKSVKEAISDVLKSLAEMLLNSAFKSLAGAVGGGGGFLSSLFGGLFGGGLPGFANGGSFNVGGAGGVDSQVVAFRASPNERVSVTKPGQERGASGVADVRVFVDENGNWQAKVEQISQRTASGVTRQGLATYDKNLNRTIGGKMANAQARQM